MNLRPYRPLFVMLFTLTSGCLQGALPATSEPDPLVDDAVLSSLPEPAYNLTVVRLDGAGGPRVIAAQPVTNSRFVSPTETIHDSPDGITLVAIENGEQATIGPGRLVALSYNLLFFDDSNTVDSVNVSSIELRSNISRPVYSCQFCQLAGVGAASTDGNLLALPLLSLPPTTEKSNARLVLVNTTTGESSDAAAGEAPTFAPDNAILFTHNGSLLRLDRANMTTTVLRQPESGQVLDRPILDAQGNLYFLVIHLTNIRQTPHGETGEVSFEEIRRQRIQTTTEEVILRTSSFLVQDFDISPAGDTMVLSLRPRTPEPATAQASS